MEEPPLELVFRLLLQRIACLRTLPWSLLEWGSYCSGFSSVFLQNVMLIKCHVDLISSLTVPLLFVIVFPGFESVRNEGTITVQKTDGKNSSLHSEDGRTYQCHHHRLRRPAIRIRRRDVYRQHRAQTCAHPKRRS